LQDEGLGDGPPPIAISIEEEAQYLQAESADSAYDSYCWAVLRLSSYVEQVLTDFDLTRRQYAMLAVIAHSPMSLTALARRANVTPPSATIMVRGLLRKGVITRSLSANDQRRIWIGLSEKGERMLAEIDERAQQRLTEIAAHFSSKEQAQRELHAIGTWGEALNRFRGEWLRRYGRL
jgi:DNA-binding MarR family transcriptional regulator